jgi:ABC-2 type transport system permease protein
MKSDLLSVVWKERKSLFKVQGGRSRIIMIMLTPIILAVVMPLTFDSSAEWTDKVFSMLISIIVPMLIVGVTIPDSFAGERERNTLETLLASRLPDRAILFGKWIVSVGFAWGITLLALVLGLITVNIKFWGGGFLFYSPIVATADLVLSLLFASLVAGAGVLISLRSSTSQQATQTLMMFFLLPLVLFQVAAVLFLREMIEYIESLDGEVLLLIIVAVLLVLDIAVNYAAVNRFQRSKLILV